MIASNALPDWSTPWMRSLLQACAVVAALLGWYAAEAQPDRPALDLHTSAGQTTFHTGERISLALSLTGPDNGKYSIDTAGYDRSGRLDIDTFEVTPRSGSSDPLKRYFAHGAFMGGGLRGSAPLSSKPVTFNEDLNEHVRFDEPGSYVITATSHRVGTATESGFPKDPYLSIRSNPLEIEIVDATPEWQADKLRSILAILAEPLKGTETGAAAEQQSAAIADLRFLASPVSIEFLTANLREGPEERQQKLMWASALGLAGVPEALRDNAVDAMARRLEEPAFPVSPLFLSIMADLEAAQGDTPEGPEGARFLEVWQMALSGLPRKEGPARAATAETLLGQAPASRTAAFSAQIASIVAGSFTALTLDHQIAELQYNWDALSRQPMLPTLRILLHAEPARGDGFHTAAELHALVLRRWFELDPAGAAHELSMELASPKAGFTPRLVLSLPGGAQPQLEPGWAQELVQTENTDRQATLAALLVRFGTGAAMTQVEGRLNAQAGRIPCESQAAMLAYTVKFHSGEAGSLIHRAMNAAGGTGCPVSLFSSVSEYAHGPALNEAAIDSLHSADPRTAADAAAYLQCFGTEAAKQPLLQRYREWNATWAPQPEMLDSASPSGYRISNLGHSLGSALIGNQAWLADAPLIAEVLKLCVGEQMCAQLQEMAIEAGAPSLNVTLNRDEVDQNYQVGPYHAMSLDLLDAKLAQFAKGTRFVLIPTSQRNRDQLQLEHEASVLFTRHGMTLAIPDQPRADESSQP